MKKIFAVALVSAFLVFAGTANAEIKIKPVVGADFQFRVNTETDVTSYFYGVNAGALGSLETSRLFTLRFGLQYKYSFSDRTVAYYNLQRGDAFMSEHSIELPATFGIRFNVFGNCRMHVDIGPTGSYVFSTSVKSSQDILRLKEGVRYSSFDGELLKEHWNLFLGGNFSFELGKFGLLGVGYRYGFFNPCYNTNSIHQHGVSLNLIINI